MQPLTDLLDLKYLQQACKALRYKTSLSNSPLLNAAMVTQQLHPTQLTLGASARHRILLDLLVDTLTQQLNKMRVANGYEPVKVNLPLPEVETELAIIGNATNRLLLGYSMLFYRYVRMELDLRVEDITLWLGQDDRFLRRCVTVTWKHLQHILVGLEMAARQQKRQLDHQFALPQQQLVSLDAQFQVVRSAVRHLTTAYPATLLLHGPAGRGKSALALQLSKTLIEEADIADVAWVNLHEQSDHLLSSATLAGLICHTLGIRVHHNEKALPVLLEYVQGMMLRQEQFIVVLDGADVGHEAIPSLADVLSHGILVVTSRRCSATWRGAERYCPAMEGDELDDFAKFLDHQHGWKPSYPETRAIIREMAGGNLSEFKSIHHLLAHIQHEVG